MKKTISIHLMGMNFLVEENAYDLIENYLKRLKSSFEHSKDQQEICDDVELRIAELASEKVSDKKHVVTFEEMKEILDTLGNPEDFEGSKGTSEKSSTDKKESQAEFKKSRRLFRDSENKTIAGVCSGLAAYFDIDVIIVRIIFVLFFFVGGFIIPIYLLLWVVVPQARTNADRLKMHGKPVNIETLKEELKDATHNFKKSAKGFEREMKNKRSPTRQRMNEVGHLFSKIGGVFLWIVGGVGLFTVLAIAFGNMEAQINEDSMLTLHQIRTFFLIDGSNSIYLWTGFVLLSLSILTSIILTGTVLFFNLRSIWLKRTFSFLSLLAFIGIVLGIYQGARLANEFRVEGKTTQTKGIVSDSLLFLNVIKKNEDKQGDQVIFKWNDSQVELKGRQVIASGIEVAYGISPDTNFHISQTFSARGKSSKSAIRKASNIVFEPQISDNKIQVPSVFRYPKKDKFRNQSVTLKILIPIGKRVITDKTIVQPNDKIQSGWINVDGNYEYD